MAAVGVQVIVGFLLAVPFQTRLVDGERIAYLVSIMGAVAGTAALLAPSFLHRALLHRGQSAWLVAVGSRLLLLGGLTIAVALVAASPLVGIRPLDGVLAALSAVWTAAWLLGMWLLVPARRSKRLRDVDGSSGQDDGVGGAAPRAGA